MLDPQELLEYYRNGIASGYAPIEHLKVERYPEGVLFWYNGSAMLLRDVRFLLRGWDFVNREQADAH